MFRQGDVLLVRVDAIPTNAKPTPNMILAEGEATGHHHKVEVIEGRADVFELADELFVRVEGDVIVTHQEHDTIVLPADTYRVVRQREYDPVEIRRVMD